MKALRFCIQLAVSAVSAAAQMIHKAVKWVWTDDHTGRHSDTTLWRNLAGFPLYAVIWTGTVILYEGYDEMTAAEWFETAMPFMYFLAGILGLTVVAYGYKRTSEFLFSERNDHYPEAINDPEKRDHE